MVVVVVQLFQQYLVAGVSGSMSNNAADRVEQGQEVYVYWYGKGAHRIMASFCNW